MRLWDSRYFCPLLIKNLFIATILAWAGALDVARAQDTNPAQAPSTAAKKPIVFGTNADLQDSGKSKGEDVGLVDAKKDTSGEKKKRGEFAVAPIPMVNPSIGNG